MKHKHGLNQYRLNYAKSSAKEIFDAVSKIEMMYQLSLEGYIDEKLAENFIKNNIEALDKQWEYFKGYIEQREDMQ